MVEFYMIQASAAYFEQEVSFAHKVGCLGKICCFRVELVEKPGLTNEEVVWRNRPNHYQIRGALVRQHNRTS